MESTLVVRVLPVIIGYLLGCVLPGYFLPLWIKHVDMRTVGDGNPGATNVRREIGPSLAFVVLAYDLTKGLVSMLIAHDWFKAPTFIVVLAGFAAIIGHKFPFYLKFRGGRGIASTVGIFLYLLGKVTAQSMAPQDIITALCLLGIYALLIVTATHDADFLSTTLLPLLGAILAFYVRSFSELTLILVLIAMIAFESSKNLRRDAFHLAGDKATLWRMFARPLAMLVIFLGLFVSRQNVLLVVGSLLLLFFMFDVLRMVIPRLEAALHRTTWLGARFLRRSEQGRISAYTDFLLGIFLPLLFFQQNVSYATLGFLSLGGLWAKIVEANYARTRPFRKSTTSLQASLAFLAACICVAYFLWIGGFLPLWVGLVGAGVATLSQMVPSQIDDNLSVPVVSGAVMQFVLRLVA